MKQADFDLGAPASEAPRSEEVMCNDAGPVAKTDADKATGAVPQGAGPRSRAARIVDLAQRLALTDAEVGELDVLLERHMNTRSPKLLDWLYSDVDKGGCGFPARFKKVGGRNTDSLARSVDALLATYRLNRDERLALCLRLSDLKKQLDFLKLRTDADARVRYSINIAGTMVGRMAMSASSTGSGTNMTTTSDRHKHLFPADPGHDLYSVDLKGADGWTIGAECAALGDTRMLDDLRAGLKPAVAVLLLWQHGVQVNQWPMDQCLAEQKKVDKASWPYRATKEAIWSSCYGAGDLSVSETILESAWKRSGELIYVSAADCKKIQAATFVRYPGIKRRMERINMLLVRDGGLTNCAGCKREFFGPKKEHSTQRDAYAYAPAFTTAYACNAALLKLWKDPENIAVDGQRVFRPLLNVHDAIVGQAPIERRDWVASRIAHWFDNPVSIAGMTLTIPYEASRGPSWGELHAL
jgi:hypothetical protein